MTARGIFNDHKNVASLIINTNNTRWIMAGIHSDNGNKKSKWDKVKNSMMNLKAQYQIPTTSVPGY